MLFTTLTIALALLFRTSVAYRVECTHLTGQIPPLQDCINVLDAMRQEIVPPGIPHPERPPIWGESQVDDLVARTFHLPRGYVLTRLNPHAEENHCEIYMANIPGKERESDLFGYVRLSLVARLLLHTCFRNNLGGAADPTGLGIVFLTARFTNKGNEVSRSGDSNYTVVGVPPGPPGQVIIPDN